MRLVKNWVHKYGLYDFLPKWASSLTLALITLIIQLLGYSN